MFSAVAEAYAEFFLILACGIIYFYILGYVIITYIGQNEVMDK